MPPQSEFVGFTSNLLETLAASRTKLDAFVENEKHKCNEFVSGQHAVATQKQSVIDEQMDSLASIQAQRGLAVKGQNVAPNGLAQRRQDLEKETEQVERCKAKLSADLEVQQEKNQSTCVVHCWNA